MPAKINEEFLQKIEAGEWGEVVQMMANYEFFKRRLASRIIGISGGFNPYPVCGLPMAIIEKSPTSPDAEATVFMATPLSISHSVDARGGGMTDISCVLARPYDETTNMQSGRSDGSVVFDGPLEDAVWPAWMDRIYEPHNVGSLVYKPILGVGSIVDDKVEDFISQHVQRASGLSDEEEALLAAEAVSAEDALLELAESETPIASAIDLILERYSLAQDRIEANGESVSSGDSRREFAQRYVQRPIASYPEMLTNPNAFHAVMKDDAVETQEGLAEKQKQFSADVLQSVASSVDRDGVTPDPEARRKAQKAADGTLLALKERQAAVRSYVNALNESFGILG